MAIRELVRMGNPGLRKIADEVLAEEFETPFLENLLEDMKDTMMDKGGIGIAAPQIGVSKQIAIIGRDDDGTDRYPDSGEIKFRIIANPKITLIDNETQRFWEGCLSVPGLRGLVERPANIKIDYLDELGQKRSLSVSDFEATVYQHELDHLFGILYVDKVISKSLSYEEEYVEFMKPE